MPPMTCMLKKHAPGKGNHSNFAKMRSSSRRSDCGGGRSCATYDMVDSAVVE